MTRILLFALLFGCINAFAQWERIPHSYEEFADGRGFKYIDDSSFVILDKSGKVQVGKISNTRVHDRITFTSYDLGIPSGEEIKKVFFMDTTQVWVSTQKQDSYRLYKSIGFNSLTEVEIADSIVEDLSGVYIWENGKGILSSSYDDQYIFLTEDYGTTWSLNSSHLVGWNGAIKTFTDGRVFVYDSWESFSYSADYGKSWETYNESDFTDLTVREFHLGSLVFNEPFIDDEGDFYVVGDYGVYTTHRNVIFKLDVENMTCIALNANEMYDSHGIFFSEEEFYFDVNDYGNENVYSGPTVYRDSSYFPVFKSPVIDSSRNGGSFPIRSFSYSADYNSAAYFNERYLVRYQPSICEAVELSISETATGFDLIANISGDDFLIYSGWAVFKDTVVDNWINTLDTLVRRQTYGSYPGEHIIHQFTADEFDKSRYHALIYDYSFDYKTCYFDYYPEEVITEFSSERLGVIVFPNPTTDRAYLSRSVEYRLYDPLGRLLTATKSDEVDLSNRTAGLYYIEIAGRVTQLVKQ